MAVKTETMDKIKQFESSYFKSKDYFKAISKMNFKDSFRTL